MPPENGPGPRVGTSGWRYDHWRGAYYPDDVRGLDELRHYAEDFNCVEINTSFYGLPSTRTLKAWRDAVPDGFRFTAKMSRYLTHMKKLKDPEESVRNFYSRMEALDDCLAAVLFQLPPRWHRNPERLESLLDILPEEGPTPVFEFRDPDWITGDVTDILRRHGAAFCIYHLDGHPSPKIVTSNMVYLRLHGPGGPYEGEYGDKGLAPWTGAISAWRRTGKEVFAFFDNDTDAAAVRDAGRLVRQCG